MTETSKINLRDNLKDGFVAFLDVMGFSNLVNRGNIRSLESYFEKITEVLDNLSEEKAKIKSFIISDSIILIAPHGLQNFIQLLWAVRRIQSALLWRKILLRGAISYGQVYYNKDRNLIVGKGYIRAYLLEQEAIYPRVIIDPSIIKLLAPDKTAFLKLVNQRMEYTFEERLVYNQSSFATISDDAVFVDYGNKSIQEYKINGNLKKVHEMLIENLYSEQKLYTKYVWLRDYFLEIMLLTDHTLQDTTAKSRAHKKLIKEWITIFKRL